MFLHRSLVLFSSRNAKLSIVFEDVKARRCVQDEDNLSCKADLTLANSHTNGYILIPRELRILDLVPFAKDENSCVVLFLPRLRPLTHRSPVGDVAVVSYVSSKCRLTTF